MKRALILASLLACAGSLSAAPRAEVRCTDGSQFKGTLLEIGPDRAIFEADFLAQPVPLKLDHVLEISLPPHRGDFAGDHIASAGLSNGDMLRGELTGVTDTEISLITWYGGEMKIRRTMVDTLDIQSRPDLIYAGPTGLDGWTQSKEKSWVYEDGTLRPLQQAMISRELKLPVKTHFAFDIAWRSIPRFRFIFFSDDIVSGEPDNCYFLLANGHYVELRKRTPRNNAVPIGGSIQIPEFRNREKVRMELLVDRKSGLFRLLVNGRIAADWNDPEPLAGKMGGGVHFDATDTSMRFSRIEINSWDGTVEGKAEDHEAGFLDEEMDEDAEREEEPEPDPSRIRLRNNDHIEGQMLGIEGGKVKLKTSYGDMELPVSRLRSFPLRGKKEKEDYMLGLYEKPKRYNGDVRAWFADGSHVTFRLESATGGRLKGYGQAFGQVDFDAKAFNRIEFNLYNPDFDEIRAADTRW